MTRLFQRPGARGRIAASRTAAIPGRRWQRRAARTSSWQSRWRSSWCAEASVANTSSRKTEDPSVTRSHNRSFNHKLASGGLRGVESCTLRLKRLRRTIEASYVVADLAETSIVVLSGLWIFSTKSQITFRYLFYRAHLSTCAFFFPISFDAYIS